MIGGEGNDIARGGSGRDRLFGGLGDDHLDGGSGPDITDGGDGADVLVSTGVADVVFGGPGDEVIKAEDAARIDCGPGDDRLARRRPRSRPWRVERPKRLDLGIDGLVAVSNAGWLLGGAQAALEGTLAAQSLNRARHPQGGQPGRPRRVDCRSA